jgi:hypothetical protein
MQEHSQDQRLAAEDPEHPPTAINADTNRNPNDNHGKVIWTWVDPPSYARTFGD